jgi:hypothetical protein
MTGASKWSREQRIRKERYSVPWQLHAASTMPSESGRIPQSARYGAVASLVSIWGFVYKAAVLATAWRRMRR